MQFGFARTEDLEVCCMRTASLGWGLPVWAFSKPKFKQCQLVYFSAHLTLCAQLAAGSARDSVYGQWKMAEQLSQYWCDATMLFVCILLPCFTPYIFTHLSLLLRSLINSLIHSLAHSFVFRSLSHLASSTIVMGAESWQPKSLHRVIRIDVMRDCRKFMFVEWIIHMRPRYANASRSSFLLRPCIFVLHRLILFSFVQ